MNELFPLISAVIPVFNGERYLEEAIESVLTQAYRPLELIIVDDGSTDGTRKLIQRFPTVRYFHQAHAGIGVARNRCLSIAEGELIAFLDADDVWMPEKLSLQWSAFAARPDLDIVTGYVEQFHSPELDATVIRKIDCPKHPMPGYHFGAMIVRRRSFDRVGPVAESLDRAEGVDWCIRAKERGLQIEVLNEVVLRRRLHQSNHSRTHGHSVANYAQVLKAYLDRRRGIIPRGV